jgi:hypothetical protein
MKEETTAVESIPKTNIGAGWAIALNNDRPYSRKCTAAMHRNKATTSTFPQNGPWLLSNGLYFRYIRAVTLIPTNRLRVPLMEKFFIRYWVFRFS